MTEHSQQPKWIKEAARRISETALRKRTYQMPIEIRSIIAEEFSKATPPLNDYDVRPFDKLPEVHAKHVEEWLAANHLTPAKIRWSLYPIGMVGRWIERALNAEAVAPAQETAGPKCSKCGTALNWSDPNADLMCVRCAKGPAKEKEVAPRMMVSYPGLPSDEPHTESPDCRAQGCIPLEILKPGGKCNNPNHALVDGSPSPHEIGPSCMAEDSAPASAPESQKDSASRILEPNKDLSDGTKAKGSQVIGGSQNGEKGGAN